jgi:hypothetical protein
MNGQVRYSPFATGGSKIHVGYSSGRALPDNIQEVAQHLAPSLFSITCLQCQMHGVVVVFRTEHEPKNNVAVFTETTGGLSSPHSPDGVKFYLDQAHRSKAAAAFTSAVAMYRAALDFLMVHQGYVSGTLGAKLIKLEADNAAGKAPQWYARINPAFMSVIKELGNGSIHPNDGDISKQAVVDAALTVRVETALKRLLDVIYEDPEKDKALLAALTAPAQQMTPQKSAKKGP